MNNAGPKLLAGFTDVPVKWIPKMWIRVNDNPITNPAIVLFEIFEVTPRITNTNTNVKMISINNDFPILASNNPFAPSPCSFPINDIKMNAPQIPPKN